MAIDTFPFRPCVKNRGSMARASLVGGVIVLALLLPRAARGQGSTNQSDEWRLRLGISHRRLDRIWVGGDRSYVQQLGLHANGTGDTVLGVVGPADAYADRSYADGFVNQDAGTPNDGNTWFWGYSSASQYDGSVTGAETLSFGASGLIGETTSVPNGFSDQADPRGTGLVLMLDRPLKQLGKFTLTGGVGLSFHDIEATPDWVAYSEAVYTVTDAYDVSAIVPPTSTTPPWTAPYTGDLPGPGPVISNTPDAGRLLSLEYVANDIVRLDMDIQLIDVTACLGLEKTAGKLRFSARAGVGLTFTNADVEREESWFRRMADGSRQDINRWRDNTSDHDVIPGAVVEASLEYSLTQRWFVGASARLHQPFSDLDLYVGPSEVTVNLDGVSGAVFLGHQF